MVHIPGFMAALFVPPDVVTFEATPSIAEIGSTVSGVALRWELSKTPTSLKLDGVALAPNESGTLRTGPFTINQSWRLTIGDDESSGAKSATLRFLNKSYWGNVSEAPADSADILALGNSTFVTSFHKTIQFGSPNGNMPCYAYPSRLGALRKIKIGVSSSTFPATIVWEDFEDYTVETIEFTNASGFEEAYMVITFDVARGDRSLLVEFE